MAFNDYYIVLGVKPSATAAEIKRNYRRLAMKYHPDKNPGDTLAAAVFSEIAEAYSILSNTQTRRDYDASNAAGFNARFSKARAATTQDVANSINALQKNLSASNQFGINQEALAYQLNQILSPTNIILLKQLTTENKQLVVEQLLYCCNPLFYARVQKLSADLFTIADGYEPACAAITLFLKNKLRASKWNKYKALVAVILAIVLCLLVFLLNK